MNAIVEYLTADSGIAASLNRIRAEYREMPGLSLTQPQMQRLFGFDEHVCEALVDALVSARVLRRTPAGRYIAD